ncbi:Uma2 family endonuclease [Microcoleus sp. PH2017_18_LLB_O_A]|uniref:Uma2 family endonuclease n=1 Tax=Microcoleus sp. PH2017_18_LLB_O_A TaxID=2798829 RepID=UPI001DD24075|nr:Uma2 family endonuclease [Microcoleus sp. PH2017_18_LLB_O_A]MCC3516358.1 Uma2 family endonuclease [Microcoleus sp. PH2017_18_LLB_O_A]
MVQTFTQPETISLEVPNSIALLVSCEQFEALALANPDLRLERTTEGELIVNPPTGGESSERNFNITGQLARWCDDNEDLGSGFDSSGGFILPNGANRSPDASWVSRERLEALTPKQRKGFVPLCPDFVVELRSASDSLSTLQTKMREYIDNGARLGWLTELSGEDVLPGFVLNLRRVWG